MQVITLKNSEVVERFESERFDEVLAEYKRIVRNAWRRKSAWYHCQYHNDYRMSWNETTKRGEDTPITGYNRFYVYIKF